MKFYTCTTFEGLRPGGTSAIVKGRTRKHAADVLTTALRKEGLTQSTPIREEDMELWPHVGEQVRLLNKSNY